MRGVIIVILVIASICGVMYFRFKRQEDAIEKSLELNNNAIDKLRKDRIKLQDELDKNIIESLTLQQDTGKH